MWYPWIPESILKSSLDSFANGNFSGSEKKLQELEPGSEVVDPLLR